MQLRIDKVKEGLWVHLSGEIDHHSARPMRNQIDENIEKFKPKTLILDFSNVRFMDSSGVGLVMGRFKLMKLYDGNTEIKGLSPHIDKIMRLAGLDKLGILKTENQD